MHWKVPEVKVTVPVFKGDPYYAILPETLKEQDAKHCLDLFATMAEKPANHTEVMKSEPMPWL